VAARQQATLLETQTYLGILFWHSRADMDFLKSAVASAISKGPAFPYSFGERVDIDQSIWTLHNGTKRVTRTKLPTSRHTRP
jgi:hypothetical protein